MCLFGSNNFLSQYPNRDADYCRGGPSHGYKYDVLYKKINRPPSRSPQRGARVTSNDRVPTESGQAVAGQVGVGGQVVPPFERQLGHGRGRHRTSLACAGTVRVHVGRAELARAIHRLHAGVAGWTGGGLGGRR